MISSISLTQSLIACASVTPEDNGAQDVLKEALTALGFKIHDLPFEGNGSYPVKNFFARLGTESPHICFAGHTDVVPVGDESAWSSPPFAADIKDGVLIGRGASDMKGGICAFVAATAEYLEENDAPKGSISFLITGDEEADAVNGTVRVLEWMKDNGHIPDMALVGEPTNPDILGQEIKIGRRGSLSGTFTVTGKQGHVAYQDLADNPLPRLIKLLDALNNHIFDEGSKFFPPTNLEVTNIEVGNTAGNVIPAAGSASFNIRFSDHWNGESLENKVREILTNISPEYTLETRHSAESFLTKPGEWTEILSSAVENITGKKPSLTTNGGTSDARFIQKYCAVAEFGLINKTVHQVDENLKTDDLLKLAAIYKDTLTLVFK